MTTLTRNTSISLGLVGTMLGGVIWLTELHSSVADVRHEVAELSNIEARLARIEAQLEILIFEVIEKKEK
jgi:hypothetical protein